MNRSLINQGYSPLRKVGSGGTGEIYVARQSGTSGFKREVIIKRIHRRLSANSKAMQTLLKEVQLAAAMSHPNVVQIYDIREDNGTYLIVMERVVGTNLRELVEATARQGKMIPLELVVNIIIQMLEGLRYAHSFRDETGRSLKIVHREICPTNVLVAYDGTVKLADFGVGHAREFLRRRDRGPAGKYAYLSPEIIFGDPVDARSDLLSVGILLYEMTVGQRLYRAASLEEMAQVIGDPIPPPTFSRAGYPVDLEIIVMRSLERNPEDRFASAEAMLEEVERFAFNTGLRISRLRLGRFISQIMGEEKLDSMDVEQLEIVDELQREPLPEDLDFDHDELFEKRSAQASSQKAIDSSAKISSEQVKGGAAKGDQAKGDHASRVLKAIQQANEAISELLATDEDPSGGIALEKPLEFEEQVTAPVRLDAGKDEGVDKAALDDELERVDRAGERPLDDLELSDQFDGTGEENLALEPDDEGVDLEAAELDPDGDAIELDPEKEGIELIPGEEALERDAREEVLEQDASEGALEQDARREALEQDARREDLERDAHEEALEQDAREGALEQDAQEEALEADAHEEALELDARQGDRPTGGQIAGPDEPTRKLSERRLAQAEEGAGSDPEDEPTFPEISPLKEGDPGQPSDPSDESPTPGK